VIGIPFGVQVLFILFMLLLAGMAYEAYIRPWLLMHSIKIKPTKTNHMLIKARKI
jgi:hypothetical protein